MADKKRIIKVAAYVVVEVDVEELEATYGRSFTNAEAREDVRESIYNTAVQAAYPQDNIDKIFVSTKLGN